MLRSIVALVVLLGGTSRSLKEPAAEPGIGCEWLTMLPGTWPVEEVLPDGRRRDRGSYVFTSALGTTNVLDVAVYEPSGRLTAKGSVGSADAGCGRLFYMVVGPNAEPTAITGRADELTRSIAWVLEPAIGPGHPYNQGLVTSRMRDIGSDAFVWSAPGYWEFRFRKMP